MFFKLTNNKTKKILHGSLLFYSDPSFLNPEIEALPPSVTAVDKINSFVYTSIGIELMFFPALDVDSPEHPVTLYGVLSNGSGTELIFSCDHDVFLVEQTQITLRLNTELEENMNNCQFPFSKLFILERKRISQQNIDDGFELKLSFFSSKDHISIKNGRNLVRSWIGGLNHQYYRVTTFILYIFYLRLSKEKKETIIRNAIKSASASLYEQNSSSSKEDGRYDSEDEMDLFWFYWPTTKPTSINEFIGTLWNQTNLEFSFVNDLFENKHPCNSGFYLVRASAINNKSVFLQWMNVEGLSRYVVEVLLAENSSNFNFLELQSNLSVKVKDKCNEWTEGQFLQNMRQFFVPYSNSLKEIDQFLKFDRVISSCNKDSIQKWNENLVKTKHSPREDEKNLIKKLRLTAYENSKCMVMTKLEIALNRESKELKLKMDNDNYTARKKRKVTG